MTAPFSDTAPVPVPKVPVPDWLKLPVCENPINPEAIPAVVISHELVSMPSVFDPPPSEIAPVEVPVFMFVAKLEDTFVFDIPPELVRAPELVSPASVLVPVTPRLPITDALPVTPSDDAVVAPAESPASVETPVTDSVPATDRLLFTAVVPVPAPSDNVVAAPPMLSVVALVLNSVAVVAVVVMSPPFTARSPVFVWSPATESVPPRAELPVPTVNVLVPDMLVLPFSVVVPFTALVPVALPIVFAAAVPAPNVLVSPAPVAIVDAPVLVSEVKDPTPPVADAHDRLPDASVDRNCPAVPSAPGNVHIVLAVTLSGALNPT